MNDRIAAYEKEMTEYKEYVELWAHEIKTPVAVSRLIMENNKDDITNSLSEEMDKLENYVEQMIYLCDTPCKKSGTKLLAESEPGKGTKISIVFQKCNSTVRQ